MTTDNAAIKREAGAKLADMINPSATSGPVESLRSINPELMTTIDEAAGVARVSGIGVDAIDDPAADDVTVDLSTLSGVADDGPDSVRDQLDTAEFAVTSGEFDVSAARPESEAAFITNVNGRVGLTQYETAAKEDKVFSVGFPDEAELQDFIDNVRAADAGAVDEPQFERSADVVERTAERRERRDAREAARDAAEAAGVDLDEFGIDATAEGEVIVQDRDTGRTRNIDANAPGGVGSAIDAATGDGQFVADDADPAASGSGDGLGARAVGAVVLLFGALAAALGWLS